ncbi:hypothetical protein HGRIS_006971 [Hohenbuehelia grisea]|uniref:Uncharacterized protein n=1 Tax=Hohenbuehelia grisea TaxID=104357 RepID=A0ABR3JB74_9AGAR
MSFKPSVYEASSSLKYSGLDHSSPPNLPGPIAGNLVSVAAPIASDEESDPDFRPGAYVYESTAKTKRNTKRAESSAENPDRPQKRRRKRKPEDSDDDILVMPLRRGRPPRRDPSHNALLEYFGSQLDLDSSMDEDNELEDIPEVEEDISEREFPSSDPPAVLKTLAAVAHIREQTAADAGFEDSATGISHIRSPRTRSKPLPEESDSGDDTPFILAAPSELAGAQVPPGDDSATESDSDAGDSLMNLQPVPGAQMPHPDSETESESEADLPADPRLKPRPGFPLPQGQIPLGPFVLDKEKGVKVPAAINTFLREYQRDGIRFLYERYKDGRGGLLGDDIAIQGSGKTIQVISFLSAVMGKSGDKRDRNRRRQHVSGLQDLPAWKERRQLPAANARWETCLIIAPSTVAHNWEREFETWGYFEVGMYNGSPKERAPVLKDFKMGRLDVVITTHELARDEINLIDSLPWSCIIVDELHRVKNTSSKIAQAYHQFECVKRFGLTGTAIQNSYDELWTILDWTNPGRLGTRKQWKKYVAKPLALGQSAGSTEEERSIALIVARTLKDKLLPKFFLRRTKDIIKNQLPNKTDEVVFCPLSPIQIMAYKRLLNMEPVQNLVKRNDPCPCGSRKNRKSCCHPFMPGDLFKYMSVLIKLSNHLALILPGPSDSPEQTARNRELAEIAFPNQEPPKYGTAMLQPQYCGKWAVLETLLTQWRKDPTNKVLIFTKSVKLLEMLEFHLQTRSFGFLKLEGQTKQKDRMAIIDQFHDDPEVFIFLISTLAGGTGLNLTGANKVVVFDPNWNPAHDLQAMDRAYRFGQTRDVSVYRLLGAGSVEELIYARQLYKQQQMAIGYQASVQTRYFEGVQGDTQKQGELFGIQNIFRLHEGTLATKMAIEKASLAELDWALSNLTSTRSKKHGQEDWLADADSKIGKDEGDLRGLGALMFDDAIPEVQQENDIHDILGSIGVTYSHKNDQVLVPSRIEEERSLHALKEKKRRKKASAAAAKAKKPAKSPEPSWPPKRKHHKPKPTAEEMLASRQMALIDLGFIIRPTDYPVFAQEFARKPPEERDAILAALDKHAKRSSSGS